jgi:pilus assembly protein Flp/PilA
MNYQLMKANARTLLRNLGEDRAGVTAIEYGLIAGLIAVALVVTLGALGGNLNAVFSAISGAVGTA